MRWAALLRTGLALGLPPTALWALSVKEWRALTDTAASHAPGGALDRAGLEALRARFPDCPHRHRKER